MRLIPRLSSILSPLSDSSSNYSDEDASKDDEMSSLASQALDNFPPRDERPAYETPPADGSCPLLACPAEVLVGIFGKLDRGTFTNCLRVSPSHSSLSLYIVTSGTDLQM